MNLFLLEHVEELTEQYINGYFIELMKEFNKKNNNINSTPKYLLEYKNLLHDYKKEFELSAQKRFAIDKMLLLIETALTNYDKQYADIFFDERYLEIIYEGYDDYNDVLKKWGLYDENDPLTGSAHIQHYFYKLWILIEKGDFHSINNVIRFMRKATWSIFNVYGTNNFDKYYDTLEWLLDNLLEGYKLNDYDHCNSNLAVYNVETIEYFTELFDSIVETRIRGDFNRTSRVAEGVILYFLHNGMIENAMTAFKKYANYLVSPYLVIRKLLPYADNLQYLTLILEKLNQEKEKKDRSVHSCIINLEDMIKRVNDVLCAKGRTEYLELPQSCDSVEDYIDFARGVKDKFSLDQDLKKIYDSKCLELVLLLNNVDVEYYNLEYTIEEVHNKYINMLIDENEAIIWQIISADKTKYDENVLLSQFESHMNSLNRGMIYPSRPGNINLNWKAFLAKVMQNPAYKNFQKSIYTGFWVLNNMKYLHKSTNLLEKTYVITPFIKAVELYLTAYIDSTHNAIGVTVINTSKKVPVNLNSNWQSKITLGEMKYHIRDNNYCKNAKDRQMVFDYLGEWIDKIRNGYFHKDMIFSKAKSDDIINKSLAVIKYLFIDLK